MTPASGAPVRQPVAEPLEHDFPESPYFEEDLDSAPSLLPLLQLLWANRVFLFRVAAVATVAAVLIAFLIPARYQATAHLMPPDGQSNTGLALAAATMSNAAGGLGGIAGDLLGLKSTSDLFVGVLRSRTLEDKLVVQFDLKKLYRDRNMTDARSDLESHTDVSVDRKSQIISITVTDHSPSRAAAMGQAYVEELNNLVAAVSVSSARRERIFLEGRLESVTQDLEAAEKQFSQFASKNTAIDVKEQGRAMVEAAATLQGQLIAAQSQYEGLREIYTDDNPRVRTIKARIDELKRQLEKLGGKGDDLTDSSSSSGGSMYPSIRKLPLLGVTYADLFRQTKIQETVLETLTKEYEMAKVQEAKEIPTVKVLDAPAVPDKRSFPPRLELILLGTALGFFGAAIWVVGNDKWHATDAADPRKLFAQEVFSTISAKLPSFSKNGSAEHSNNGTGASAAATDGDSAAQARLGNGASASEAKRV